MFHSTKKKERERGRKEKKGREKKRANRTKFLDPRHIH
jgi:hypothetical protein